MKREKRKIIVACLNRSEYSRIRSVIKALMVRDDVETLVVVLDSKYSNTSSVFKKDNLPIHHKVSVSISERSPFKTAVAIGEITQSFAKIFDKEKPDILVILGDRYEALGVVIAAAFQNIFIAHIQGGEVTGTHDEHTRHAISKFAHLHFPATELSAQRLIRMGELPDMVVTVGCPGSDLLIEAPKLSFEDFRNEVYKLTNQKEVLEKLTKDFFLVAQFPVPTEIGEVRYQIEQTLDSLRQFSNSKLILTPIPDAGGDIFEALIREYKNSDNRALVIKHLPADLFVNAMRHCKVMIGNSSAGIRESGYFGVPTLNIGSRQNGREQSSNILNVSHDTAAIVSAIRAQLDHPPYDVEMIYGDGKAGEKIADILAVADYSKIQKKITY